MAYLLGTIIRVGLHFKCGPFRAVLTREYRVSTTPTGQPPPEAIVVGLYSAIREVLEPCLTSDSEPQGGTVQRWTGTAWEHEADQELLGFQGSGPPGPLPAAVSGLVRFWPADPASKAHGRVYVPFPSKQHNDSTGRPTTGYLSLLADLGSAYIPNVGISSQGAPSPFDPKLLDIRAVLRPWSSANMVAATKASPLWATQRRRGSNPPRHNNPFG